MAIVSSEFFVGALQADGRAYVREEHTDHLGQVHRREYGPVGQVDYAAICAARAVRLAEILAEAEFLDRITRVGALGLQHQVAADFATRLRERYRLLGKADAAYLSWWVIEMINAGHVTDAQVRNAFGMTVQQYTNLKTNKLQPQHDLWVALEAAVGE